MATMTVKNAAGADETVEKPLAPGQATMATSRPVVIASDQSAVPVSGTFWQAIQPVSGTVGISGTVPVSGTFWQATQPVSASILPLPTGASKESTLTAISGKLPASLGSKTGATSLSVVPASDATFTVSTHAVTQSGAWDVGTLSNLSQLGGQAISMGSGVRDAGTQRITIATDDHVAVSATSLPLPTGAATSSMQSTANSALGAPADAAWTGGDGSVVALLKSLATAVNIAPSLRSSNPPSWSAPVLSTTSATVLAANASRKSAIIRNHGDMPLLLDLSGGTASPQRFQVYVPPRGTFELSNGYTGSITGVLESGTGTADVVEFS